MSEDEAIGKKLLTVLVSNNIIHTVVIVVLVSNNIIHTVVIVVLVSNNIIHTVVIVSILQATDADSSDYAVIWYHINTNGAPVTIGKETGIINTAGSFANEAGLKYRTEVEAYDNRGNIPSLSSYKTIFVSNEY